MQFRIKGQEEPFTIFTTRADTVYGVTFMVLAPESEYVARVTTDEQKAEVEAYLDRCRHRTERERIADRTSIHPPAASTKNSIATITVPITYRLLRSSYLNGAMS